MITCSYYMIRLSYFKNDKLEIQMNYVIIHIVMIIIVYQDKNVLSMSNNMYLTIYCIMIIFKKKCEYF